MLWGTMGMKHMFEKRNDHSFQRLIECDLDLAKVIQNLRQGFEDALRNPRIT